MARFRQTWRLAASGPLLAALLVAAGPAVAESAGSLVAAPGLCAEAGDELAFGPLSPRPERGETEDATEGASGAPHLRFAPATVAARLPAGLTAPPPDAPGFQGPGACDNPGSGCLGTVLPPAPPAAVRPPPPSVSIPPPASPCGGPGFPCP